MISLEFSMDLQVLRRPDDVVPLDAELDAVMTELVQLAVLHDGFSDPAMSFDAEHGVLTVEAVVTADEFDAATTLADSCIRSAIHAAGGHTPRWSVEKRSQRADLVEA